MLIVVAIAALVVTMRHRPAGRPGDEVRGAGGAEHSAAHEEGGAAAAEQGIGEFPDGGGDSWKEIDDPTRDGWDTEAFHDKVKKQFEILGKVLTHPGEMDAAGVEGLVTEDFACGALRPDGLVTAFEDEALVVRRNAPVGDVAGDAAPAGGEHRGAEGLAQALGALARPFAGAQDLHYKFKVFRVLASSGEVTTRQFFALSGRLETGLLEENATWVVRWVPGSDGAPPRMRSIRVEEFEQAAGKRKDGLLFSDCTASVLGGNASYKTQFLRGLNHWLERLQDPRYFALLGNPGVAVGDVDGDGLEDLYICQEAGLPNRLFLQNRDGTARDASEGWGVDWLESSRSALVVDLDSRERLWSGQPLSERFGGSRHGPLRRCFRGRPHREFRGGHGDHVGRLRPGRMDGRLCEQHVFLRGEPDRLSNQVSAGGRAGVQAALPAPGPRQHVAAQPGRQFLRGPQCGGGD